MTQNLRTNSTSGITVGTGSTHNIVASNRVTDSGTGSGIDVGNSDYNNISDNHITDSDATGFAINLDADAVENVLSNNSYSGAGASSINDAGTNTQKDGKGLEEDGKQNITAARFKLVKPQFTTCSQTDKS